MFPFKKTKWEICVPRKYSKKKKGAFSDRRISPLPSSSSFCIFSPPPPPPPLRTPKFHRMDDTSMRERKEEEDRNLYPPHPNAQKLRPRNRIQQIRLVC